MVWCGSMDHNQRDQFYKKHVLSINEYNKKYMLFII